MTTASAIVSPAVRSHQRFLALQRQAETVSTTRAEREHIGHELADYQTDRDGFRSRVDGARASRRGLFLIVGVAVCLAVFDYLFAVGSIGSFMMEDYWQSRYGRAEMPVWIKNGGSVGLVVLFVALTLFFSARFFETAPIKATLREASVEEDDALRRQIRNKRLAKGLYLAALAVIFYGLWTVSVDKAWEAAESDAVNRRSEAAETRGAGLRATPSDALREAPDASATFAPAPIVAELSAVQRMGIRCTAVMLCLVFLGHLALSSCPTCGVWHLPGPSFNERSSTKENLRLTRRENRAARGLWQQINRLPENERQSAIDSLPHPAALAINEAMGREIIGTATKTVGTPTPDVSAHPEAPAFPEPPADDLAGVL